MIKKYYSALRKQVYELAISTGVDTETMGGRRVGRGIDNIREDFLPTMLSDLKSLRWRLGIKSKPK